MDINNLSLEITALKEEKNFFSLIKNQNLDWELNSLINIPFLGRFIIVGADDSLTTVICQKFSRKCTSYKKRYDENLERTLIDWKVIKNFAVFKNK